MGKLLVALVLVLGLTTSGVIGLAGAVEDMPSSHRQIAQASTSSIVGTPGAPGSKASSNHAFPSSSGTGISSNNNLDRNQEYAAAIESCQSLPTRRINVCIKETNKRFGQM